MVQDTYKKLDQEKRNVTGLANLYVKGNRLYIRLPDKLGLGRNKYIATGLSNLHEGRVKARNLLTVVNNDILLETFDPSLEKYLSRYRSEGYKSEVEKIIGIETPLQELWDIYCNHQKESIKDGTLFYYTETIGSKLRALPVTNIYKSEDIKSYLLLETTKDYARRVLTKLSTLFKWCADRGILKGDNPYPKLLKTFDTKGSNPPPASPLSLIEEEHLLSLITPHYLPLTRFLLLTGCRPSEAIGITWDKVKEDHIILGSSITKKGNKVIHNATSKNNKVRTLPLYPTLQTLLSELPKRVDLILPNSKGEALDYGAYYKVWKKIYSDTTPYSCRDTFITRQIEKGIPIAVVAQWCDNSVKMIEDRYLKVGVNIKPF